MGGGQHMYIQFYVVLCLFRWWSATPRLDLGALLLFWGAKRGDVRLEGRQLGFSRREACIRWI